MTGPWFLYLDESGDLGFNPDKPGRSRHFTICILAAGFEPASLPNWDPLPPTPAQGEIAREKASNAFVEGNLPSALTGNRTGPTTQNPVAGAVESTKDLIPLLEGVKDARTVAGKQLGRQPSVQAGVTPTKTPSQPQPSRPVSPATPGLVEGEGDVDTETGVPGGGTAGNVGQRSGQDGQTQLGDAGIRGDSDRGTVEPGTSVQPGQTPVSPGDRTGGVGTTKRLDDGQQHVTIEAKEAEETKGAFTDSVCKETHVNPGFSLEEIPGSVGAAW